MRNDRLYLAATELVEGEGDAKKRVVNACRILNGINLKEVSADIGQRIRNVLAQAGEKPSLRNAEGDVILGRDKFFMTSVNKRNATYAKLAKQIYGIYWDELHSK